MKDRKGFITENMFYAILAICATIMLICFMSIIKNEKTEPRIVKASYTDREIYIDTKTFKPIRQGTEEPGYILRIEFPHIKDANNNYMQLEGVYPLEFADRIDMAKNLAILKSIVTREELDLFKPHTRETIGNVTTIIYER